jgi:4'-phosphopantetheinyl transferase
VKKASATSAASAWCLPPKVLRLGSDEVHVWRAHLDQDASQIDSYLSTLSIDERARADRFYFQRDREHFVVAHGMLRAVLGLYLNTPPQCLSFVYSPYGKPALDSESGADAIRFNLSHSDGVALCAVARGREIGIDVERIRSLDVEQIAAQFFSQREIATLETLPLDLRRHAFFLCWTRKEAYIKAKGEGLSIPLDEFDVSLIPGEPPALLCSKREPDDSMRWFLREPSPIPGYAAATAVNGSNCFLSCWDWP